MTPLLTSNEIIQIVLAVIGTGAFGTAVGYWFLRSKTKAEATKLGAERDGLKSDTQDKINKSANDHIDRQDLRIKNLEDRLDEADRREHIVAVFVYEASTWMHKAWRVMSDPMKREVGEPPKADPTLFDGLISPPGRRPTPKI